MLAGERCKGRDRGAKVGRDEGERVAHLEHERAVEHVLRRRALVERRLKVLRQPRLDGLHERDHRHAGDGRLGAELLEVKAPGGDRLDGCRQSLGSEIEARRGAGERRLDAEHGADASPVREHGAHLCRREERARERGIERREAHRSGLS